MDDATRRIAARLAPLTNYERSRVDRPRFTLDTMRALLDRLGRGRPAARVVQIGGSKGKGTTAAWVAALGRAAGLSTGVYASPHVVTILERIQVGGAPVPVAEVDAALDVVLAAGEGLDPAPSFFEVMTAAALEVFARREVELIALEVGLGGRLDATTAVDADLSVVTQVELEHTDLLGDTVEAIAAEKACVARPGRVLLHGVAPPGDAVLAAYADRVGCRLETLGRDFGADPVGDDPDRVRAWRGGRAAILDCGARPPHEDRSVAFAFATLDLLWPDRAAPSTVARPLLPGRTEWRRDVDGAEILLDGAHTEASVRALVDSFRRRCGDARARVLFASARGKRWREVLAVLEAIASVVVVVPLDGTASEDPDDIAAWLRARSGPRAHVAKSAAAGLTVLRAAAGPRLVTGSFYLVGAVLGRIDAASNDSTRESLHTDPGTSHAP